MNGFADPNFTCFEFPSGIVSARDLLHCYLELRVLTPNLEGWSEQKLQSNPPRLSRLKILRSILKAYEINSFSEFKAGSFICENNGGRYAKALNLISKRPQRGYNINDLQECYRMLLQYREVMEEALSYGSGYYHIGSELVYQASCHIYKSEESCREHLRSIDDILISIISPEAKYFSVKHLKRDFAFPEADVGAIDLEWL